MQHIQSTNKQEGFKQQVQGWNNNCKERAKQQWEGLVSVDWLHMWAPLPIAPEPAGAQNGATVPEIRSGEVLGVAGCCWLQENSTVLHQPWVKIMEITRVEPKNSPDQLEPNGGEHEKGSKLLCHD